MPEHEVRRIARTLLLLPATVTLVATSYAVHIGVQATVACYGLLARKRIVSAKLDASAGAARGHAPLARPVGAERGPWQEPEVDERHVDGLSHLSRGQLRVQREPEPSERHRSH